MAQDPVVTMHFSYGEWAMPLSKAVAIMTSMTEATKMDSDYELKLLHGCEKSRLCIQQPDFRVVTYGEKDKATFEIYLVQMRVEAKLDGFTGVTPFEQWKKTYLLGASK